MISSSLERHMWCRCLSYSPVKMERIDKILSSRGGKSRSEVSKLLHQGKVQVNGRIVRGRGDRFLSNAEIRVSSVELPFPPLIVAYNKPVGILSSIGDPWNRPNLSTVIKNDALLNQMHPVVRIIFPYYLYSISFRIGSSGSGHLWSPSLFSRW
jgi:23S rRNA-/tRNA-specific pseudouridylate synthase